MSTPLTLAQVRDVAERYPGDGRTPRLCATIEWLAERVGVAWATCETCPHGPSCTTHPCYTAEQELWRWLRGEA